MSVRYLPLLAIMTAQIGCAPNPLSVEEVVYVTYRWEPASGWDPAWVNISHREVTRHYRYAPSETEEFPIDPRDVVVRAVSATGAQVAFAPSNLYPRVYLPQRTLEPGTWSLQVDVEGELLGAPTEVEIGDYGQVENFDSEALHGARFVIEPAGVAPSMMELVLSGAGTPLVMAVDRQEDA
ncbi:MAG: hypothetical protein AB8H79_24145 [Myxococcota bacterium]